MTYLQDRVYLRRIIIAWSKQENKFCSYGSDKYTYLSHTQAYGDEIRDYQHVARFQEYINNQFLAGNGENHTVLPDQIFKANDARLKLSSIGLYHFEIYILNKNVISEPIEKVYAQIYNRPDRTTDFTDSHGRKNMGTIVIQCLVHFCAAVLAIMSVHKYIAHFVPREELVDVLIFFLLLVWPLFEF